jgi:hypothetical protein
MKKKFSFFTSYNLPDGREVYITGSTIFIGQILIYPNKLFYPAISTFAI